MTTKTVCALILAGVLTHATALALALTLAWSLPGFAAGLTGDTQGMANAAITAALKDLE